MRYGVCGLLAALLTTAFWSLPSEAAPRAQLDYVEKVLGAEPDAELPLLVVVHGLGDTPENYLSVFDDLATPVRLVAPRAPDPHAVGSSWFPIDDLLKAPRVIRERADALARLIERLARTRPTRGRPIVTGFSQGGVLSFALAAYHPELRLAAALPVAGLLPKGGPPVRVAPPPFRVVALHGTADPRIPYVRGVDAVERLRAAGGNATMFDYPGVGHAFSEPMLVRYYSLLREELTRATQARATR